MRAEAGQPRAGELAARDRLSAVVTVAAPAGFVLFERVAIEQSLARRFAEQVSKGPERVAVKVGPSHLTYAALDRQANRVAHAILARGLRPSPVAVVVAQGLSVIPSSAS